MTKKDITLHLWEELTKELRDEFRTMLRHCGDKDEAVYKYNAYQLKDGKPHGYIAGYRSVLLNTRSQEANKLK